jgi:type VI secretion system secreted protein VgrG
MSDTRFSNALADVLLEEGRYALIKGDTGGETYCGIARNYNPKWAGWKIIDAVKSPNKHLSFDELKKIINSNTLYNKLFPLICLFYQHNYYEVLKFNKLPKYWGEIMLNFSVNIGSSRLIKMVQRTIGTIDDGIIGDKTISAMNNDKLPLLKKELIKFYKSRRNFPRCGKNWLARVDRAFKEVEHGY